MITQNFENVLACLLAAIGSSDSGKGGLPVIDVYGVTRFLTGKFYNSFPYSVNASTTLSATTAGISVGTGGSAEGKQYVNLENTVTSGVSLSVAASNGCETGGNSYRQYLVTVTNTGSEEISIREIGYKQQLSGTVKLPGGTANESSATCLFDRTVLDPAVVIQPGDAGVIQYRLTTVPMKRAKSGVNLYSFTYGSDAAIAEMIDAAREGLIDLQADAGWRVGDVRTIHLDAFTGGGSTAHAAQDAEIVITQFGDYNGCGCLFQFDFLNALSTDQRWNSSSTNVGGYGASEMYLTTLPAMVAALPEWLRTRLKTFNVVSGVGGGSSETETVPNNKLALRAQVEVSGQASYSAPGEGSQVARYAYPDTRSKTKGRSGLSTNWFLRSPSVSGTTLCCYVASGGSVSTYYADSTYGLAPFGCV